MLKPSLPPLEHHLELSSQPFGLRFKTRQLSGREVVLSGLFGQLLDPALHPQVLLQESPETVELTYADQGSSHPSIR